MANNWILLYIVLLSIVLIFGRQIDDSKDLSKDETIITLQRLLATLNTKLLEDTEKIEEIEKQNTEYGKQLLDYENTNCMQSHKSMEIYMVHVPGIEPFPAPCESQLEDGGWTVIQRRLDGSVNFERSWNEYRNGFGNLKGEFFLGLEKIHRMTAEKPHELLISYQTHTYQTDKKHSGVFLIGSEEEDYMLKTADSSSQLKASVGEKFTTFDRDNDKYWWGNCAKEFKGGWWFGNCDTKVSTTSQYPFSNLNGPYLPELPRFTYVRGISYAGFTSLKSVQMMIRPEKQAQINEDI